MEATYPANAIILKREPRGECDSRVVVYTRERGKLELIARGTKKIKSKMSGHLEPLCVSRIMVVKGKQFDYIGSAVSENCQANIKSDLDKLIATGRAFDIFNSLVKENFKEEKLYNLLDDYIRTINSNDIREGNFELLTDLFILKLLALLGYRPEIEKCIINGEKINPSGNIFDFKKGGIICENCLRGDADKNDRLAISDNCIKILRLAIKENFNKLKVISIEKNLKTELKNFVKIFKNYQA